MSWLSSAVKKIPVVGGALNKIGKALPSGGQILGGIAGGPLGTVLGGSIDGNTTPLQKTIGNTVAGTAGAIGGAGALGLGGLAKGAIPGLLKMGGNALGGGAGNLLDLGLGGLSAYNAAQLGKKSSDFAQGAYDQSQANWKEREPLRMAGIQGMLKPQQSQIGQQAVSNLGGIQSRNPFAAKQPLRMGGSV